MVRYPATLCLQTRSCISQETSTSSCPFYLLSFREGTWAQPLPTLEMAPKLFLSPVMLNHEMFFISKKNEYKRVLIFSALNRHYWFNDLL